MKKLIALFLGAAFAASPLAADWSARDKKIAAGGFVAGVALRKQVVRAAKFGGKGAWKVAKPAGKGAGKAGKAAGKAVVWVVK